MATAVACAPFAPWELAVMAGWIVAAATFVAWTWLTVGRMDAAATRAASRAEDDSRTAARLGLVIACSMSLVAVVATLHRANRETGALATVMTLSALAAVVLSWLAIQTQYTLRYADLHYGDSAGGIDFPGDGDPDFRDFAYVAFGLGMTYQVADTDIRSRAIRRTALGHSLLSYLFGAAIIAATINVVAGLV